MAVVRPSLVLLERQKTEITELMKKQLIKGDNWYLIDCKWFKQWKKYVGYDGLDTGMVGEPSTNPGPIDNSFILKSDFRTLKENLTEENEFSLVPEDAWNKLVSWYSLVRGQHAIMRHVIEEGFFHKKYRVEVYPLKLHLCCHSDMNNIVTRSFSHADTVESLVVLMRQTFGIAFTKEIQLWHKYVSNTYEILNKFDSTLQDSSVYSGQLIIIEPQNDDGSWSREAKACTSTNCGTETSVLDDQRRWARNSSITDIGPRCPPAKIAACTSSAMDTGTINSTQSTSHGRNIVSHNGSCYDCNTPRNGPRKGLCGLRNLGNTCFMNSAIQCMSNVPSLTEYMLDEDRWRKELNVSNLLGMRGEIATSYAELIKNIWSGQTWSTDPQNFKHAVGRFKPEFSGYQQQDSQELMAFLLDGLHEDLNRIKQKPYVEMKEANNRPDDEVATEAWADYIKRNNSVIVDTFHGLLKSTLVCPECFKISVKFDPFCYLSLPLPVKKERHIEVILVPCDPMKKPCQYKVTVLKTGVVSHLCNAVSDLTGLATEKMVVVDVYNHRFHRILPPIENITAIMDRDDIFIYEVPATECHDLVVIPVYMREDGVPTGKHPRQQNTVKLFGVPILVAVPRNNCTYDILYNCVLDRLVRYVRVADITEDWWKTSFTKPDDKFRKDGADGTEANIDEDSDEPTENHDSKSESDEDSLEKDDDDISDSEPRLKPVRLFRLVGVNSYGNAEMYKINDDGQPIHFSNHPYIAAHWNAKAKKLFFDEKLSEDLEVDKSMNLKPLPKRLQLSNCLDLFTTTERLGEHDPWATGVSLVVKDWYCPVCKKHQQATKKFDLWQLPRVLVIHLKRFSFTRFWRDKLDTFVRFPTRGLDMSPWIINREHAPATYNLIAVSNHYGGMGGGHYTAYAKNKHDGKWYHFDDSSVSPVTEESVVTSAGYVLVYEMQPAPSKALSSIKMPPAPSTLGPLYKGVTFTNGASFDDDDAMETS